MAAKKRQSDDVKSPRTIPQRAERATEHIASDRWVQTIRYEAEPGTVLFVLQEVIPLAVWSALAELGYTCSFGKGRLFRIGISADLVYVDIDVEADPLVYAGIKFTATAVDISRMQEAELVIRQHRAEFDPKQVVKEITGWYQKIRQKGAELWEPRLTDSGSEYGKK